MRNTNVRKNRMQPVQQNQIKIIVIEYTQRKWKKNEDMKKCNLQQNKK